MKRIALMGLALAAISAAGVGGYWAGIRDLPLPGLRELFGAAGDLAFAEPAGTGPVIYYQDPDGKPLYSTTPHRTGDGRPFRSVHAGEDVSFEDKLATSAKSIETSSPAGVRHVLYYRNPMGLPDTSPTPKKDSMGRLATPTKRVGFKQRRTLIIPKDFPVNIVKPEFQQPKGESILVPAGEQATEPAAPGQQAG